jgi:hypothetical protein
MFENLSFETLTVYGIMFKNILEPDRPQMTIWRMRITRSIPKATNTLSEYVTLIVFHCKNGCTRDLNFNLYVHCVFCCVLVSVLVSCIVLQYTVDP